MTDRWIVHFDHPGIDVHLSCETFIDPEGFGKQPFIYPVTIVQARYRGTYEDSAWLCFPVSPTAFEEGGPWESWADSDIECMEFWVKAREEEWPIGHGSHPTDSYFDLIRRVCQKQGLDPAKLFFKPTFEKEELVKQDEDLLDL